MADALGRVSSTFIQIVKEPSSMPINTTCSGCGQTLTVSDEHAGKRARCPSCGQIYTIPLQSATQSSPEAITPLPYSDQPPSDPIPVAQHLPSNFWMRAADGNVYGPVDRTNLDRWFSEGRVGVGYQVREGEAGQWRSASDFHPASGAPIGNSSNPYAATVTSPGLGAGLHRYPQPDRGVLVLIMGILSWMLCPVFGIVAVVVGRSALNDIDKGLADPNGRGLVTAGYWIGLIHLIVSFCAFAFFLLMFALSMVG